MDAVTGGNKDNNAGLLRLRDEGMEDNMTINGEPVTDPHLMSKMLLCIWLSYLSILAINGLMFW